MAQKKVIGLLVGRENTFPGPFLELVNQKGAADGISAELAVLGWRFLRTGGVEMLRAMNSAPGAGHEMVHDHHDHEHHEHHH